MKECGKETELRSCKQVLDRLGPEVAHAALRLGTLPYVPHSLLLPGHGMTFPGSHEFVLTKRFWHDGWKDEVQFPMDDEDPAATEEAIAIFLATSGTHTHMASTTTHWRKLCTRPRRGSPTGGSGITPTDTGCTSCTGCAGWRWLAG